ncbi:MAG: glycosyltransferase family 4 protein [Flavobacteriales bacterium]|nr:glycosyltransferase family 4 protein [Flavobacteriales bacterium]MCW8914165.1 glycosyltransferase family 4 protein [Flavobacteriales bacterium]MCW8938306.1 glycosyltransferase family 4 protein [Flavobacteriales bacterium]MCW8940359.1 glycosyltransferase family 4 protein [Flavobacteriales bacterium]MCW8969427.1 glycosyltransferase family 4 protein [Flavobacteriales bacterium]
MKILQICHKPPLPALDGGCKAMHALTEGFLANNISVKILTIATQKHPYQPELFPTAYLEQTNIEHAFIDTAIKKKSALANLFSNKSYNISRFYNKNFEELITATLQKEKFDVVLLESLYATPYINAIRKNSNAKVIYRSHNIEFEVWQRTGNQENNAIKKKYLHFLAKRLKKYEQSILNLVDGIAAITKKDEEQLIALGCKKAITTIPFGINLHNYQLKEIPQEKKLFHIGSMDWMPNQEAIKWFLNEVWSAIIAKEPTATFHLAGKNMPDEIIKLAASMQGIINEGEVDNANDFIRNNNIMVVPLFSGSGMRIKIIEAMAMGKLVIGTSVAFEGIAVQHNKNGIIANTANEFKEAILMCLQHPEVVTSIGQKARKTIEEKYNNTIIVKQLINFIAE